MEANAINPAAETNSPYGTALVKAVKILEFLADQPRGQGASEIARQTGMNKATAFKLLETLQMVGFVEKSPQDSRYKLGFGLIKIACNSLQQIDIVTITAPFLAELNQDTAETIHLAVLNHSDLIYVAKLESTQPVRTISRIGSTAPLYCTGMGKAMLSTFTHREAEAYLAGTCLERHTPSTITDKNELRRELELVRQQGYAVDNSEHEADIRCIAVPLLAKARLWGSISISAPKYRMDDAAIQRHLPALFAVQRKIIERLAAAF